jgi:multicomponent Na+:H+ antiporter subunit E
MKNSSSPYVVTFVICFLLWLLLTASFAADELISGVIISLVVSIISAPKMKILNGLRLHLGFFLGLLSYIWYFFVALIKANFDLAKRVVSKDMKLHPDVVEIKTTMRSDLGKLFLANSITLTPGTLTVDVVGDSLLVHWIDVPKNSDINTSTQLIVAKFEKYLKGFLK